MRKLTLLLVVSFIVGVAVAKSSGTTDSTTKANKESLEKTKCWVQNDADLQQFRDSVKESQYNELGRYKLYKTKNKWTFLELDTQTGQLWQVQFSVEGSHYRFRTVLDDYSKLYSYDLPVSGRFELYETENTYNFILLDRIDGRCWQVQWHHEKNSRGIWQIN
ncbi:MAG TPA: hypothetical protein PLJ40_01525 [Paludibacteraceae bacterium]|nr:hypothetical protein [Paludibacteraceae bacterium]HQB69179.1 hypothetical protein [Paludibacteraceae bacterium]HRS67728.1 hypothetical protein [Paludibacteraceae bacterium]